MGSHRQETSHHQILDKTAGQERHDQASKLSLVHDSQKRATRCKSQNSFVVDQSSFPPPPTPQPQKHTKQGIPPQR